MERDPSNCKSYRNGDCGICNSAIASSCQSFEYVPLLTDDEWTVIKSATTSIDSFSNRKPRFSGGPSDMPVSSHPNPNKPNSESLFRKLKEWRLKKAAEEGVPAYVIFHDSTLLEISRLRPASTAALLSVRGIGKIKYQRYADEIYEIIKAEQKERT